MKKNSKKLSLLLSLCLLICSFSFSANAVDEGMAATESDLSEIYTDYVPNEIVLITNYFVDLSQYTEGVPTNFNGVDIVDIEPLFMERTPEEISARIERMGYIFSYTITISSSINMESAMEILIKSENIVSAEPNYIIELEVPEPDVSDNTSLISDSSVASTTDTGAITQKAHEYLSMSTVWGRGFIGSSDVVVAVLDTGFVQTTDLEDNLKMSVAYDVADNDSNVTTTSAHGNKVAGIIGADYNDGGVNGICRSVSILPVKICKDSAPTSASGANILAGVDYAISFGCDIINLSFTQSYLDSNLRNLITNSKVLFVTAACNSGKDMSTVDECKGKLHDDPYWIVVGAANFANNTVTKRSDSNYSSKYCDLFAPGTSIDTTGLSGTTIGNQTSMATPHVTAACALIMSRATHLTPLQVKEFIMDNVTTVSGLSNYCVSGGMLSILGAVEAVYNEDRSVYGDYTKGDIDNDGDIDSVDYTLVQRMYNGTYVGSAAQKEAADVDDNGTVDSMDYILVRRYYFRTYYFTPI